MTLHNFVLRLFLGIGTVLLFAGPHANAIAQSKSGTLLKDRCPVSQLTANEREAGIAGLLLLKFVEQLATGAIDLGVNVLKEAAKDKSISSVVSSSGYLYRSDGKGKTGVNPSLTCIVYFRGTAGNYEGKEQPSKSSMGYLGLPPNSRTLP